MTDYGESSWCDGVICGRGRVVVHGDGWRAEHARVEALAPPDDPRLTATLAAIAARLGVPLLPANQLEPVAELAGAPVPATLRRH